MHIIDKMIITKVSKLMDELGLLSIEAVEELERKKTSTSISDMTSANEIPSHIITRMGEIQMQIQILKRIMDEHEDE